MLKYYTISSRWPAQHTTEMIKKKRCSHRQVKYRHQIVRRSFSRRSDVLSCLLTLRTSFTSILDISSPILPCKPSTSTSKQSAHSLGPSEPFQ